MNLPQKIKELLDEYALDVIVQGAYPRNAIKKEKIISQVEALVRNDVLSEVERELTTPTKMLDTGVETNSITYEGIKHRINNLRVK